MRLRGNNSIEKRDWILIRSLFTRDQKDFRRLCRLIDQIDVGAVPLAFVQVFCKGQQVFLFLASRGVSSVHGDAHQTVRLQTGKTASHGPHGGACRRGAAFIRAGQVAQIEYGSLDEGLYMIRQMLVGIANQLYGPVLHFFCKACVAEPLSCGVYGFLQDIEGIELCRRKLGQPEGIVPVSAGSIYDNISFGDVALYEIKGKFCDVFD